MWKRYGTSEYVEELAMSKRRASLISELEGQKGLFVRLWKARD